MDLPKPPEDQELRNIIDKLAQFVARNGPEFEQMTKEKQEDNPRFYFLFGGEFFNYYKFRVNAEQTLIRKSQELQQHVSVGPPFLNQQQQQQILSSGPPQSQPPIWQNNGINNMNNSLPPNVLTQQINELQEQMRQSETNLSAQHQVLMQQQKCLIDDTIKQLQDDQLRRLAEDFNVNLTEFENVLQPIAENCTKESIANGKMWIFNNCNAPIHYEAIARYLLKRITQIGPSFDAKLHLMYLINDLFNHCMRKGDDNLKRSLDKVIVPIFCCTFNEADDEKQQKLTKLLKLWEMNQYFERTILDQLQNPPLALANYKSALCNEFSGQINSITNGQLAKYNQLQKQHSDFVAHQQTKIQQLQQQQQQMVANVQQMPVSPLSMPVNPSNLPHPRLLLPNQPPNLGSRPPLQFDGPPPPPSSVAMFLPLVHQQPPPPPPTSNANQTSQPLLLPQLHQTSQMPVRLGPVPQLPQPLVPPNQPFSGPLAAPHFPSPLPNHQFFNAVHNSAPIPPKEVIPDVPYYELPAGLMAPLVKLEDFEYKSIVPKDIRLPPPAPPNERLLQAVELFYAPPTHERPRNSDGWEQLGLYEFFKAKSQAKKDKEDIPSIALNEIENFEFFSANSVNSDTSPINSEKPENNQISAETNSKHSQSSEQSLPSSHSRHRSPSPKRRYREYREEKSPRKNKSRKSRSRSPSSSRRRRSRSHSKSRSRSRSPIRSYRSRSRSPTPPHSFTSYGKSENTSRLDESNKGHQMLKKMGWSGSSGLGASEQGIQDPIRGGEVRDREDQYRGVGIKNSENDPFENFRKNKGQAFMQRISQGRNDK